MGVACAIPFWALGLVMCPSVGQKVLEIPGCRDPIGAAILRNGEMITQNQQCHIAPLLLLDYCLGGQGLSLYFPES